MPSLERQRREALEYAIDTSPVKNNSAAYANVTKSRTQTVSELGSQHLFEDHLQDRERHASVQPWLDYSHARPLSLMAAMHIPALGDLPVADSRNIARVDWAPLPKAATVHAYVQSAQGSPWMAREFMAGRGV